jgi:hypothetical protein
MNFDGGPSSWRAALKAKVSGLIADKQCDGGDLPQKTTRMMS